MDEIKKVQEERSSGRVALGAKGSAGYDSDIYGEVDRSEYSHFLPDDGQQDEAGDNNGSTDSRNSSSSSHPSSHSRINPSRDLLDQPIGHEDAAIISDYRAQYGSGLVNTRIADRETQVGFCTIHGP